MIEFTKPADGLPTSKTKSRSWRTYVVFAIVVLAVGSALFFFIQSRQFSQEKIDKKELKKVVEQVSQLMDVPADETPVLATVTDKDKVNTQAFFARSENGDKVLLYTKLGRAILYRPSTNRIVDVTLINTTQTTTGQATQSAPETTTATTPQVVTAVILNGTRTAGLASTEEKKLQALIPNLQVSKRANASQQTYPATVVVDISKKASQEAKKIADTYQTTVTDQIPAGESTPSADLLIILGESNQ